MIGQQLGSYSILEEIGSGGMATVYRALQPNIKRDVAIKIIKQSQVENLETIQRFQREAHSIAGLEHIHILPIYDFDGLHDPPYIVMRYLEGGTLADVMSQGALTVPQVLHLMRQICAATDYAHRQGIIHRDLKPSNVMIDLEGNTFVSDFGLARHILNEQEGSQITNAGVVLGTPDYISPEQIRGENNIDHRVDIYSLGVMLFQMLTGNLPFVGQSPLDVMKMHLDAPIPSVLDFNRELPSRIDQIISRAMAKNSEDRYSNTSDLYKELQNVLGNHLDENPLIFHEAAGTSLMLRLQQSESFDSKTPTILTKQYKTVTALFANAAEYAFLVEDRNGAESAARHLTKLWYKCKSIVEEHGGLVLPGIDTELFALWGVETIQEYDAEQAVHTALQIQLNLQELAETFIVKDEEGATGSLPINIGLDNGLVLLELSKGETTLTATGSTISIANRLMQEAEGKILITSNMRQKLEGVFFFEKDNSINIRGRSQMVDTYRVIGRKARSFQVLHRGSDDFETRLVGRDAELRQLQKAHYTALEDHETQVVTIVGAAGKGKSRLVFELAKWAELHRPHRIFFGRSTEVMLNRPYAFIRDIVSFRFKILDNDPIGIVQQKLEDGVEDLLGQPNIEYAHMIGHLCGFDLSESPYILGILDDTPQLVRRVRQAFVRLVTQVAQGEYPAVFLLENIHYADNDSLDLLNEMFLEDESLPLLVICTTRPALFDRRAEWGSGQHFHTQIDLEPLDKRDSRTLIKEILHKATNIPEDIYDFLVKRAEGNPYFLEELIKMFIRDGIITREDNDHWVIQDTPLDKHKIPTTVYGLLEARLDRVGKLEKVILQRAAVIGRIFYDSALKVIDKEDDFHVPNLESILNNLISQGFIYRRESSTFADSTEYIFARNLFPDVILQALLEQQIKTYNQAAARWLLSISGNRKNEYFPLIAQYYERGGDVEAAATYYIRAGMRALQLGSSPLAYTAFKQAKQYLPNDFNILRGLGQTTYRLKGIDAAHEYLQSARAVATNDEEKAEILVVIGEIYTLEAQYDEACDLLQNALTFAHMVENRSLLSRVFRGLAGAEWRRGNPSIALEYAKKSLQIAKEIESSYYEVSALNYIALILRESDPSKGLQVLQEMLEKARKLRNKQIEMVALANIAVCISFGATDVSLIQEAKKLYKQALDIATDLGNARYRALYLLNIAQNAIKLREIDEAKRYLFEGLKEAIALNSKFLQSVAVVFYAHLLGVRGEIAQTFSYFDLIRNTPMHNNEHEQVIQSIIGLLGIDESVEANREEETSLLMDFDEAIHKILNELEG